MKKQSNGNVGGGGGNAKVNIFMLQIEGDSATVQRTIEAAEKSFMRSSAPALRADIQTPKPPAALAAVDTSDTEENTESPDQNLSVDASAAVPRTPARKRVYSIPEVVDELRANQDPDPFKEFVAGRSIDADINRGILAAVWMREKRDVRQVTTNHIHTCFKMMGWKLPEDPGSLLRSMKKQQYVRSVSEGVFELTSAGDNKYGTIA